MFDNITQYILVLLLIGLTVAGANYLLGFSKEQRARRREAKLVFSSAFKTDLDNVLQSGVDAREVLSGKEVLYLDVKDKMRKYLQFWQKSGFDQAWELFFYHPENKNIPYLEQYMDFGSLTKRKKCHHLLSSRIGKLLEYANVQP